MAKEKPAETGLGSFYPSIWELLAKGRICSTTILRFPSLCLGRMEREEHFLDP